MLYTFFLRDDRCVREIDDRIVSDDEHEWHAEDDDVWLSRRVSAIGASVLGLQIDS